MAKRLVPHVRIVLHFLKMDVDELITWALKEIARLQRDPDLKEPIIAISVLKKQVIDLMKTRKLRQIKKASYLKHRQQSQLNTVLNSFTYIAFQVATIANDKAGGDEPIARIIIDRLGFKPKEKSNKKFKIATEEEDENKKIGKARRKAIVRWQLEHSPVTVYLKDN